jgi:regulator of cell morphogenesis and NO signaling
MDATSTLAELAVTEPAAARVFYRHGLDFCCSGRRPLADACRAKGLDADAILAELAAERHDAEADATRWDQRPLAELVDHIVVRYHSTLRRAIPELLAFARKVEVRHAEKPACPHGLARTLESMLAEVEDHLAKEEQILFPMILEGQGRSAVGPVQVMEHEHEAHGRTLDTLRGLTGDYEPPAGACVTWQALYLGLRQLDRELMEHIHLENNVLFPRALAE